MEVVFCGDLKFRWRTLFSAIVILLTEAGTVATPFAYSGRDLLLGMRQGSNPKEMVVNLGQASKYTHLAPGTVISITEFTPAQLRSAFPALNGIQWSVAGTTRLGDGGDPGIPNATLYLSRPRSDLNFQSAPWLRRNAFTQGGVANKVNEYAEKTAGYSASNPANPNPDTETLAIISSGHPNSYGLIVGAGNLQNTFQGNIENSTGAFAIPCRSDLYELMPGASTLPGTHLGYFEFRPDGTMIFKVPGGLEAPFAPTLQGAVESHDYTILSWRDLPTETGYRIERHRGVGDWQKIADLAENTATYRDTNLTAQTDYYYRIIAVNAVGESEPSNEVILRTFPLIRPAAPVLTASTISIGQIYIYWTDLTNETGFVLQRRSDGEWKDLAVLEGNVLAYNDFSVAPWTEYNYGIRAFNIAGSSEVSVTTARTPTRQPILENTSRSFDRIGLKWTNLENEKGYRLERRIGSDGEWMAIRDLAANVITHRDEGLEPLTEYSYRVAGYSDLGDSPYSLEVKIVTQPPPLVPPDTPALRVLAATASQVTLSWSDSFNEDGYILARQTGVNGAWVEHRRFLPDVTSEIDTGLTANTVYLYRIVAFNADGFSLFSEEARVETVPLAPKAFAGEVLDKQAVIHWTPLTNVAGYRVERSLTAADLEYWQLINTTPSTAEAIVDRELVPETGYKYRVRAFNATGNSAPSEEVFVTTKAPALESPSMPSVRVTSVSDRQVVLEWDDVFFETGYRVERQIGMNSLVILAELAESVLSYADFSVANDSEYSYRVVAYNRDGSTGSDAVRARTLAAPSGSILRSARKVGESLQIRVSGEDGGTFRVQGTGDFRTWKELGSGVIAGGIAEIVLPIQEANLFIRTLDVQP